MGSKIAEEGFKAESIFVAEEERKAQTQAALDLADERTAARIEEERVQQLEEQAEADRITQLKKDAEARSSTRAELAADPDFDMALWYAELAADETLEGRLASLRELDLQVFDPDGPGAFEGYGLPDAVGITRGDYLEEELSRPEQAVNRDWAEDQALGMPFIEMAEKSGVSIVSELSEPFEVNYPYEYDNNNLYMKLPPTGGTLDLTQGFSPEERKMYLDLEARGQFIDTSNGLAGPGEYTMMWVEDPPEESGWHKFLNNPALNFAAALIPGGPQALAIVKGVSGMTLHASDWISLAGGGNQGPVEGIDTASTVLVPAVAEYASAVAELEANRGTEEEAVEKAEEEVADTVTTTTMTDIMDMAVGLLEPNLAYDLDGDGEITSRDTLIFMRDPEGMEAQAQANKKAIEEAAAEEETEEETEEAVAVPSGAIKDIMDMAVGKIEPDLAYDFDGDGRITSRDALLYQQDPEGMEAQIESNRETIDAQDSDELINGDGDLLDGEDFGDGFEDFGDDDTGGSVFLDVIQEADFA